MRKLLTVIFIALSFTLLVNATPPGWLKYTDPKGRFEISFPGQPMENINRNLKEEKNVVEKLELANVDNGGSYELIVRVYKESLISGNNQVQAKEITDKMIKRYIGYNEGVTSVTDEKFKDLTCVTYMIANKPTPAYFYKHKFIFNGNTLYQLIINYSLAGPNRGSVPWFINSLIIK